MIIQLIKDFEYKGTKLKKGFRFAVSKDMAITLCQQEIAVSDIDIPCEERQKKAAKTKKKKKVVEVPIEDATVEINNEL